MRLLNDKDLAVLPPLYSTDEMMGDAVAWVKWFTPDSFWTWFLVEYDSKEDLAFGLVQGLEEELGYFKGNLIELVKGPFGMKVEKDPDFQPVRLTDIPRTGEGGNNKYILPFDEEHFSFQNAHFSDRHRARVYQQKGSKQDWQMAVTFMNPKTVNPESREKSGYYLLVFRLDQPIGGTCQIRECVGKMTLIRPARQVNSDHLKILEEMVLQEGCPVLQTTIDQIAKDQGVLNILPADLPNDLNGISNGHGGMPWLK